MEAKQKKNIKEILKMQIEYTKKMGNSIVPTLKANQSYINKSNGN